MRSLVGWLPRLAATAAVCLFASWAAADRPAKLGPDQGQVAVEMFSALEEGQIDVRVIPENSTKCRLRLENKTDKPLSIRLPDAFAGVPVLAQFDDGGFDGGGFDGGGGGGQSFGGGMGGGRGGMGGGFFNVLPEKVGIVEITTVCLEHGKPEPRPAMKYRIVPIEQYTDKAEVHELCRMLGKGMMPQRVAQVAAWHLANGMSWQELAAKQIRRANGMRSPYFSPQEIHYGQQAAAMATKLAEKKLPAGKGDSLSQN